MTGRRIFAGENYVDDLGNPGVKSGSEFLPSSRHPFSGDGHLPKWSSWRVWRKGVHFTEIFNGTSPWKNVPVYRRAELIKLMAEMMYKLIYWQG